MMDLTEGRLAGEDWSSVFKDNRYAQITNLYIPECLVTKNCNLADTSNKVDASSDVTEDETDRPKDQKSKCRKKMLAEAVDNAKMQLLRAYFQYYCSLWPTTSNREVGSLEDSDEEENKYRDTEIQPGKSVRQKLSSFKKAFNKFCKGDMNKDTCLLYDVIEIYGDSPHQDQNFHFDDPNFTVNLLIGGVTVKKEWKVVTKEYLDKYYPTDGVYRIPAAYLGTDKLDMSKESSNQVMAQKQSKNQCKSQERLTKNSSVETKERQRKYDNLTLRTGEELKEMCLNATGNEKIVMKQFLSKEEGNLAEEEVLQHFEKWGHDLNLNMFIIGGYEYQSFLQNISPKPENLSRIKKGDFDILILCQQLGLIALEVKSTSLDESEETRNVGHEINDKVYQFIIERMRKGWKQLMKGCYTAREMNRDLPYVKEIPSIGFLAFPNLEKSTLGGLRVCSHHRNFMLFKEDFTQLHKWLDNRFPCLTNHSQSENDADTTYFGEKSCSKIQASKNAMTREQYRTLVSRFVGLVSAVQVETETIKETNTRMTCIFKTPEQLRLLSNEATHAVIFGDYGTGKSLVLSHKGVENISNAKGENRRVKVHFVPCADLSNFKSCYGMKFPHQANAIKSLIGTKETEDFVCYESFLHFYTTAVDAVEVFIDFKVDMVINAISKIIINKNNANDQTGEREEIVEHQFFFDEFPIQPLKGNGLRNLFLLDTAANSHQEGDHSTETKITHTLCTLWVSIATHSLGVSPDENPFEALKSTLEFPTGVSLFYLDRVMRVPKNIYRMIRRIETYIAKGHGYTSSLGHTVDGITPKLYRLRQRHCTDGGILGCECKCSRQRLTKVLKQITDSLEPREGKSALQITLMLYYVMSSNMFQRIKKLLQDVCSELSIVLQWNTMQYQMTGREKNTFTDGLIASLGEETDYDLVSEKDDADNQEVFQEEFHVKENTFPLTIQVVDQRTFAGCETSVLIFLDPFEMRHWFKRGDGTGSGYHSLIFTRCTGHFILVTWPKEEASAMWEKHLDEYKEEVLGSDATENFKDGRCKYIDSGRRAHRESDETCLDVLLKEKFIVNVQTLE